MPEQDIPFPSTTQDTDDLEGYTDPIVPLIELEVLLARPPSLRKRLLHSGLLLAALAVALITFWGIIVPKTGPQPSLPATEPFKPQTVLITSNVNYGTMTINGKQQRGSLPMRVPASFRPPYQVTVDAAPFLPRTCQIPPTQPRSPGIFDPCMITSSSSSSGSVLNLSIYLTINDLPPAQQSQINTVISQAMTIHQETDVPSQSYFATSADPYQAITSQRAQAALWATAFLVRDPLAYSSSCVSALCPKPVFGYFSRPTMPTDPPLPCEEIACPNCEAGLCYGTTFEASPLGGQFWEFSVKVRLSWRFRQPSGKIVSEVSFPESQMIPLDLLYDGQGRWSIPKQPDQGSNLGEQLAHALALTGMSLLELQLDGLGVSVSMVHQRGIEGCELAVQQHRQDQGTFIWRFGVLLAADAGAQRLLPMLPVAPLDEITAVGG
jgi:hypothetical protein